MLQSIGMLVKKSGGFCCQVPPDPAWQCEPSGV